jgi:hypothetical protein
VKYTLVVSKWCEWPPGNLPGNLTIQAVAWMPGFESKEAAYKQAEFLRGTVYPNHQFEVFEGDVYGPLRQSYDALLWYEPIRMQDLPRHMVEA